MKRTWYHFIAKTLEHCIFNAFTALRRLTWKCSERNTDTSSFVFGGSSTLMNHVSLCASSCGSPTRESLKLELRNLADMLYYVRLPIYLHSYWSILFEILSKHLKVQRALLAIYAAQISDLNEPIYKFSRSDSFNSHFKTAICLDMKQLCKYLRFCVYIMKEFSVKLPIALPPLTHFPVAHKGSHVGKEATGNYWQITETASVRVRLSLSPLNTFATIFASCWRVTREVFRTHSVQTWKCECFEFLNLQQAIMCHLEQAHRVYFTAEMSHSKKDEGKKGYLSLYKSVDGHKRVNIETNIINMTLQEF